MVTVLIRENLTILIDLWIKLSDLSIIWAISKQNLIEVKRQSSTNEYNISKLIKQNNLIK